MSSTTTPSGLAADIIAVSAPPVLPITQSAAPAAKTEVPMEDEPPKPAAGARGFGSAFGSFLTVSFPQHGRLRWPSHPQRDLLRSQKP